jgi:1-acyl-sn-glycerol-3-phosphate acyltransferase
MIVSAVKILSLVFFSVLMATLELLFIPFNRDGTLFHRLARLYGRGVLAIAGVKLSVEGTERVDFSRNYIFVSNHASLFDIPVILAGVPAQIRLVYKKELEKIPVFGWGLKFSGTYISIDRGSGHEAFQSLEEAANKIRNGASVILFAEGTRSSDGKLQPFKRGAFNLAAHAGVSVVPLTIKGSHAVMPKHSFRIRPGQIRLVFDRPVAAPPRNGRDAVLEFRDRVRSIIEQHCQEP